MYSVGNSTHGLSVFCIDNDTYARAAEQDNHYGVQSSGIKNLRRFCYQAAAQSKLRAANHFITKRIPDILESMKLRMEQNRPKTSEKSYATIKSRKTVDDVRSKIQRYGAKSKLERADSLQGRIVDEAISALPKWTKMERKRPADGLNGIMPPTNPLASTTAATTLVAKATLIGTPILDLRCGRTWKPRGPK